MLTVSLQKVTLQFQNGTLHILPNTAQVFTPPDSTVSQTEPRPSDSSMFEDPLTSTPQGDTAPDQRRLGVGNSKYRRLDTDQDRHSPTTYVVGDYLRAARSITLTHAGWVELRCWICGGNSLPLAKAGELCKGPRGLQVHVSRVHPSVGKTTVEEVIDRCTFRQVEQAEIDAILTKGKQIKSVPFAHRIVDHEEDNGQRGMANDR